MHTTATAYREKLVSVVKNPTKNFCAPQKSRWKNRVMENPGGNTLVFGVHEYRMKRDRLSDAEESTQMMMPGSPE